MDLIKRDTTVTTMYKVKRSCVDHNVNAYSTDLHGKLAVEVSSMLAGTIQLLMMIENRRHAYPTPVTVHLYTAGPNTSNQWNFTMALPACSAHDNQPF